MKTAKDLMLAYLAGTAKQSGARFGQRQVSAQIRKPGYLDQRALRHSIDIFFSASGNSNRSLAPGSNGRN